MYREAWAFLETAEQAHESLVSTGGFTLHPTAPTLWWPKAGFFVGVQPESGIVIEGLASPESIADWLLLRADQRGNKLLGGWYDPRTDKTYLDYSVHVQDRATAEALGRHESQVSIYDCEARAEIVLNPR